MVWVVSRFRFKAPPGISSSCISPLTSSGQRSRASWASQRQKSATLSPQPGGKPRKFVRTCGGIGGGEVWSCIEICHTLNPNRLFTRLKITSVPVLGQVWPVCAFQRAVMMPHKSRTLNRWFSPIIDIKMSAHKATIHFVWCSCLSLPILPQLPVPGTPVKLNRGSIWRRLRYKQPVKSWLKFYCQYLVFITTCGVRLAWPSWGVISRRPSQTKHVVKNNG